MKDQLIQDISIIDKGFQSLYDRIKIELVSEKDLYQTQIMKLKVKITEISDLTVKVLAQEERNKNKIEQIFEQKKKCYQKQLGGVKSATNNYANAVQATIDPFFIDKKK